MFPKDLPRQPKVSTAGTIFGQIFGQPLAVEDMPATETTPQMANFREKCIVIGNTFTHYVDLMRRSKFLGQRVTDLGKLIWYLVGNRVIPSTIGPTPSGTIGFCGEGRHEPGRGIEGRFACIMVPEDWLEQIKKDPIMQFGGVVCTGSQARDYFNNRIDAGTLHRGYAFEAESLFGIQKVESDWKPNKYQCQIMEKYPLGTRSLPPGDWYECKPWTDPRPGETI
jgi:hypothetical protein